MASLCVKVAKQDAQLAKLALLENYLIDDEREPFHDEDAIYFPVLDGSELDLKSIVTVDFELVGGICPTSHKKRKANLATLLADVLPLGVAEKIPRAFNIVGDIAVLELDDELLSFKGVIAEKLRELHPFLKSIYMKESARSGDFRTTKINLVWGTDDPVTVHKENGFRFRVDVKDAFYDPRLEHEHARVINIVRERARSMITCYILDLFCGVGPFIIPLANEPNTRAWGVDLNPRAIDLLEANIAMNKLDPARLHSHAMDARDFLVQEDVESNPPHAFDAIILNLPRKAHEFLEVCRDRSEPGALIFWYTIAREFFDGKFLRETTPATIIDMLRAIQVEGDENEINDICPKGLESVENAGFAIREITRVKPFSPYKFIYCFELQA
ncbi:MAG TPA: methyltransferase domain-containing protein [Candidatus Lokiarchaeia archaeon]|nr:methyltransferase domain-containing protein [Candidatus Lokiarchaeia archaeon]